MKNNLSKQASRSFKMKKLLSLTLSLLIIFSSILGLSSIAWAGTNETLFNGDDYAVDNADIVPSTTGYSDLSPGTVLLATVSSSVYEVSGTIKGLSSDDNVTVKIYDSDGDLVDSTAVTVSSGKTSVDYSLSVSETGNYTIKTFCSGYKSNSISVDIDDDISGKNITLSKGTSYAVSGTIKGLSSGDKVTVKIYNSSGDVADSTTATVSSGNSTVDYSLSVSKGDYKIKASCSGYNTNSISVDVTDDSSDNDITLSKGTSYEVSGTIKGLSSNDEVKVKIYDNDDKVVDSATLTVSSGNSTVDYSLSVNGTGKYTIKATCSGYNTKSITVDVDDDSSDNNITLSETESSSTGGGSSSSSSSNSTTGSTSVSTSGSSINWDSSSPSKFNDVGAEYSWAKTAIESLAASGYVKGTSDTTFSPGKNITRADFITILVRALQLSADVSSNFDDVNQTSYYYNSVGIAKSLGVLKGTGDNKFNGEDAISRQDMMVIIERAMKVKGKYLDVATVADIRGYSDASQISDYAVTAVAELVLARIITGNNGTINPKGTATRAETAVVIYRLFNR